MFDGGPLPVRSHRLLILFLILLSSIGQWPSVAVTWRAALREGRNWLLLLFDLFVRVWMRVCVGLVLLDRNQLVAFLTRTGGRAGETEVVVGNRSEASGCSKNNGRRRRRRRRRTAVIFRHTLLLPLFPVSPGLGCAACGGGGGTCSSFQKRRRRWRLWHAKMSLKKREIWTPRVYVGPAAAVSHYSHPSSLSLLLSHV